MVGRWAGEAVGDWAVVVEVIRKHVSVRKSVVFLDMVLELE